MSLTAHRVIQYMVIITLCTLAGGGYWYWQDQQAKAAVALKTATDTGLIGYWSFDEGSGTKAEDFSPANANTGTLTNSPTWVDGKVGKALSFDGTDDWVDIGSSSSLNASTDYTISMWVYNAAGSDTYPTLLNRATQATNNGFFWIYTTGTNEADLNFQYADGTNFVSTTFSGALSTNTWQHVVFTFDNASKALKLYINGSQFSTTRTLTGSLPIDDGTLYLGTYNGTATNYSFLGYLDEVRIYTSALSAGGVTNLYQSSAKANVNASENSDLTSGLVGLWSFNGADVSGTTAYDRSGQGNNGTLTNGPTVTTGKIGQALSFDNVDDKIVLSNPSSLNITGTVVTISAWIYPKSFGGATRAKIFDKITGGTVGYVFQVDNTNVVSGLTFCVNACITLGTDIGTSNANSITLNQWQHVVVVYNGSGNLSFYVNGVLAGPNGYNLTQSISDNSAVIATIGGRSTDNLRTFDGYIDETRVYNRALSATEIWNLYQAGGGARVNSADSQSDSLERGLAGYWKLDDGSGTSATDASTNGNTGTLTNGPTWTTGQIGGAANFDGSDDVITIPDSSLYTTSAETISFWTKVTNIASDWRGLVSKTGSGDRSWSISSSPTGGIIFFTAADSSDSGSNYALSENGSLTAGQWAHVVAVFNGSGTGNANRVSIYINGSAKALTFTGTIPATLLDNSTTLNFGSGYATPLPGSLDEVRIYNRALSSDEIAKLYKSTAPDNPDAGLKGYWSFNGPDVSGTTAYDRSGAGNNGTLTNGPTVTPGKIGQALNFDGTDDYIDAGSGSATDDLSVLTVSAWIKPRSLGGANHGRFVEKGTVGTNGWSIYFDSGGGFTFDVEFPTYLEVVTTASGAGLNTWQHVVVVWDGSVTAANVKIYVNGVLQSHSTDHNGAGTRASDAAGNVNIGRSASVSGRFFDGGIDEVRVYNRAFTQTEVTNLYNLGR